jgi:hypothetical protein
MRAGGAQISKFQTSKLQKTAAARRAAVDFGIWLLAFWDLRAQARANAESEHLVPKGSRVPPRIFCARRPRKLHRKMKREGGVSLADEK